MGDTDRAPDREEPKSRDMAVVSQAVPETEIDTEKQKDRQTDRHCLWPIRVFRSHSGLS